MLRTVFDQEMYFECCRMILWKGLDAVTAVFALMS